MVATWVRCSVRVGAALALVSFLARRAEAHGEDIIPALAAAALAPSDAGVTVASGPPSRRAAVLGWSYQLTLGRDVIHAGNPHRIIGGLDLLVSDSPSWRGRLGYRFAWRDLIAGVGPSVDARGFSLSPEVGFKFAHLDWGDRDEGDPSLHLLARGDVTTGGFRGVTFLVGWNLL